MSNEVSIRDANGNERLGGFISPGPLFLLGPFPFTFATNGLTAGVPLFTPAVGDVIYDIGVSIPVAFSGTTPFADVGTFNGGTEGVFQTLTGDPIDLTAADADVTNNAGLSQPTALSWFSANVISHASAGGSAFTPWEITVSAANPLLLVVSQDGTKGGAATGATAGAGAVYVLTASPAG